MKQLRPTCAVVDLEQLQKNLKCVRGLVPQSAMILAAVKGDAYGHGAVQCAEVLSAAGADWFGVALVEEGRTLRKAGIDKPILCMGGAGPFGAAEALAHRLTPLISHIDEARAIAAAAQSAGTTANVHIKVDTGMGRLGVPLHHWAHFLDRVADFPQLHIEGIASHLAFSESPAGTVQTQEQIRRFEEAAHVAKARGVHASILHTANSGAILQHPSSAFDMVRPGLLLYGYDPQQKDPRIDVHPIMRVTTQVLVVRDLPSGVALSYGGTFVTDRPTRVATLPVGYADGFPRALSNKGEVLIHGARAPILGRVCMDMCIADVTDVPIDVHPGDEAVILGRQGAEIIDAWDMAKHANTIPYEILTGFSERIPRTS